MSRDLGVGEREDVGQLTMNYRTLFRDRQLDYSIVVAEDTGEFLMVICPEAFPCFRRVYRLTPDEVRKFTREDSRLLALAEDLVSESSQRKYTDRLVSMSED